MKEGKQADLINTNLRTVDLRKAKLQYADLRDANLYEANFRRADLEGADLENVNLQKANLRRVNLRKSNLVRANLSNSSLNLANLQGANLYEANIKNANFYSSNLENAALGRAEGKDKIKTQYANLTGVTGLLGNEFAQADVTGTKLPDEIKEFKTLEIVKETSQNARKIFFAMLLGCVYSWLTIATTTDVKLLTNTASSPLPIIGTEIPIAWFYLAAPLVLICLYFYFHLYLDNLWEGLASLPAIFPDGKRLDQRAYPWLLNTLVRKHFKKLKKRSLIARMKEWITIFLAWWVVPITLIAFWLRYIPRHDWWGTYLHIGVIVISVTFSIIFYRLSALTLQGKEKLAVNLNRFWSEKGFYLFILRIFLFSTFISLVGFLFLLISVSTINGFRTDKNYKPVLNNFLFDFHQSSKYFVPWAFGRIGYDVFADFREKNVSEKPDNYALIAKEERIKFVKRAKLKEANLKNADMFDAFLVKADLRGALLNGANLFNVNLQEAALWGANLKQAQLASANLQQAKLAGTNLQQANLGGANLKEASLNNADLTGAKNLTIEQLSKVKTLYQTKLDPYLMEQVKRCCPQLLEKLW